MAVGRRSVKTNEVVPDEPVLAPKVPDGVNLSALGRERAMYANSPRHQHKVMMVDTQLAKLGYAADDQGRVRPLPPVVRPLKEQAVSPAPERAVDPD